MRSSGIGSSGSSSVSPARDQREVLRAQHGLDLDRRLATGRPTKASWTRNSTVTAPSSSAQALDLADLDAGDAHRVVGLQPGGLGELGLVDGAAADERQGLRVEGQQHQDRDDA